MKKRVVAVIPARMGSSRFPGKPLAMILNLPMIEHVRRRVCLSDVIDDVYVATCDQEIFDVVIRFGGKTVMTKNTHERCTDRVEEAAHEIDLDIAVMVQGDEPLFMPEALAKLVEPMLVDDLLPCTNLISVIHNDEDLSDVDIVKTVLDEKGFVMYFSRSPVPHIRVQNDCPLFRQTGVSAFTKSFLHTYSKLQPTMLEVAESVDFLRIIGHRYPIKGVIYDRVLVGVDRPDDIGKVEKILSEDPEQKTLYERILNI
ncbi:MAG: 3-deoxy-manno-octulosonate cytidylyltransferase [Proteobacteria bacterium]|nr:3-deoxy-manno-octulosonate cytidylyltransferase [Pseudomonadota bacterium]MBU4258142.1 3-deoxy-manno-octulosonate cytidylyltransferase [Pseudomonadota bacterium]MBU4286778.1 3-deoxy-manno-octulosonate cytidylyltransferase [Pseudomonadota bacterium]MBU4413650.1 3-deoxy-manno-octulosonate cytidylyltransferase [Pseudomonadota bacterium]MCG2758622.1 3-deoxy-manno-octulosonate cytidylyltransferase [Desulfobacteraceae bacterium]